LIAAIYGWLQHHFSDFLMEYSEDVHQPMNASFLAFENGPAHLLSCKGPAVSSFGQEFKDVQSLPFGLLRGVLTQHGTQLRQQS